MEAAKHSYSMVTAKLLLNTIMLKLKIVCHLSKLDIIENCTKNSDFRHLSGITVDQYWWSDESKNYKTQPQTEFKPHGHANCILFSVIVLL